MELVLIKDYFERFYQILRECQNNFQAYLILEEEYFDKYGRYNYTNYNAFINAKSRFYKSGNKWERAK